MCSDLSLWHFKYQVSYFMWEFRPTVILISLAFVWSIQPGCLSLSCHIIIIPTDVYNQWQKLNLYLMSSNTSIVISADICAQIFLYVTLDQISNDNNSWHSCQLPNNADIDQQFLCWYTLYDRSILSFRWSWSCPPVVVMDRCYWSVHQCWQVWSLIPNKIHHLHKIHNHTLMSMTTSLHGDSSCYYWQAFHYWPFWTGPSILASSSMMSALIKYVTDVCLACQICTFLQIIVAIFIYDYNSWYNWQSFPYYYMLEHTYLP